MLEIYNLFASRPMGAAFACWSQHLYTSPKAHLHTKQCLWALVCWKNMNFENDFWNIYLKSLSHLFSQSVGYWTFCLLASQWFRTCNRRWTVNLVTAGKACRAELFNDQSKKNDLQIWKEYQELQTIMKNDQVRKFESLQKCSNIWNIKCENLHSIWYSFLVWKTSCAS